ncbi:MAG: hypothetical protein ACP5LB_00700 [Candidatus Bathyarchaeia archaeon]
MPKAEGLVKEIVGKTDYVLVDRMNYNYADWVYKKYGLEYAIKDEFFKQKKIEISEALTKEKIPHEILF